MQRVAISFGCSCKLECELIAYVVLTYIRFMHEGSGQLSQTIMYG
jgi:hypothetical protein